MKYFQRNITIAISDTTTLVVSLSDTTDELLGENNDAGTVGRVESDLNTLSRNDAAGEGYPSTARFNAAATGSSASMTRLRADAYDGANSAEFSELNSRLGSLYSAIVVLPNYTATAVELISINDTINALIVPDGTIDQTVDSIAAIQDLIDNKFPNTTAFLSNVNDLLDLTERLDLAPLARNVSLLSTILLTLPDDLNDLLDIVEEVLDALPGLIDPLYDLLVVQTASFNATIYRLPKDLDTLRIFNDANDTITSGINDGREIIQEIRDAIQSINDVNATEYISQINDVEASIDDAVFTFDITEITDLVNSFDNSIDIDFSTINGHLADLRTALIAVKIDDNLINSLNDVQQNRIVLEERLERAIAPSGAEDSGGNPVGQIGDYLLLIQGNCANDATIYCSIDSDCSGVGGVCQNQGRYRCSENGNALAPFTTCNVDSDCSALGGSSFCLADDNRAAALQGILIAYGNENSNESKFPDTSITNDFDEVRTYGNFNFTAEIVRLNNAQRDVNSINTTVYEVQLDDISSQITAFDIAEINSAIADAKDVLDDVNYDTFDSTIDDLKKIVRDVQNGINDGITIVEGIEQFLFNSSFLAKHLNDLSRESLASIKSTQGVGPMIRRVGDVIEEAIDFFRDLLDGTYDIQNIKVTENLEDFADTMDRVSANPNTKYRDINDHGALHYLLSLSNITSKSIVNANDPQADTITTSKAGVAYEDNEYCVTRECFAATQASLEDEPAEGVSLTGPQIAGLLWLPIAILLLVG